MSNHQAQQRFFFDLRSVYLVLLLACLLPALVTSGGCHAGFNSLLDSKTGVTTLLFRHSQHVSVDVSGVSQAEKETLAELQKLVSSGDHSKFDASFEQFVGGSTASASSSISSSDESGSEASARQQNSARAVYEWKLLQGISRADRGQISEAENVFDKLLQERPDDWRVLLHRWQLKVKQGDDAGAKADRERGMALNPEVFSREYSPVSGVI